MKKSKENMHNGDVDLRQIDDEVVDIYTPKDLGYPIIERKTNALIWPEEVKGGIDLNDIDNVTEVPKDPNTPLKAIRK